MHKTMPFLAPLPGESFADLQYSLPAKGVKATYNLVDMSHNAVENKGKDDSIVFTDAYRCTHLLW